ncbi:NAD(P)-binding protein [Streptomyces malaysiensis]|uniref:NAD(P)-binding protein n=1 Tax=Streptomyces malaysiensis TaxID=92644 RepID=UPI002742997F|nr:NAD(P)-binding protein [Streptomyces samsunensis]
MLMERVDVAVIGGGQSGLATAHALRQRGIRPVVLGIRPGGRVVAAVLRQPHPVLPSPVQLPSRPSLRRRPAAGRGGRLPPALRRPTGRGGPHRSPRGRSPRRRGRGGV